MVLKRRNVFLLVTLRVIFGILVFFVSSSIVISRANAQTNLTPAQKAALQDELKQVEAEAAAAEKQLQSAQSESASLNRDISVLTARIKTAQLNIKAKNLLIQTLGNDIDQKQKHIENLEAHIERGKQSLADIFRKMREIDDNSVAEVLLSQDSVSGFFKDFDTFQSIQDSLQKTFDQLEADQASTTAEKEALDTRRNTEIDARYVIQQQQNQIAADQKQKQQLLSISKGNEKAYSSLLTQKKTRAAQIQAALFPLAGGGQAIPFGTALQYANIAYQKTGVRPAFLLAIMTQESSLGKNVGSCYVTDRNTGDGINAKTGTPVSKVMAPTRDIPHFIEITSALGSDWNKAVVSCPQSYGWGGAMGPAQFIPSTWKLFEDRIRSSLSISGIPNPWNPEHAFIASAMYLGDLGASYGGYTAERNAACKYYSGKSCGYATGNTSYGNSVIAKASTIQTTMIDLLSGF